VSFHTFRHTCASLLFAEGTNVKQVQEWLGHAGPVATSALRYYGRTGLLSSAGRVVASAPVIETLTIARTRGGSPCSKVVTSLTPA
jgi:hypothetical protein